MGWTFTYRHLGKDGESLFHFLSRELNSENHQVLAVSSPVIGEAYVAVRRPKGVMAVVCLLRYRPKSQFNFGYKDMGEDMGPCYYRCPRSILEMLTPLKEMEPGEGAADWRRACWERIHRLELCRTIGDQAQIRFLKPIQFRGYRDEHSAFVRIKNHGRLRNLFWCPGLSCHVRIADWRERPFEVLSVPASTG